MQTSEKRRLENERYNKRFIKSLVLEIINQINPEWAEKIKKADRIWGYIVVTVFVVTLIAIALLH